METAVLNFAFPVAAAARRGQRPTQLGQPSSCRIAFFATSKRPIRKVAPLSASCNKDVILGCNSYLRVRGPRLGLSLTRRGVLTHAQENDGEGGPLVHDVKPFYATFEFWIQVAVVILTIGFVDAGYSGDWSRIGALSHDAEALLRLAAYAVVPLSAALVWAIGKRKTS